MPQLIHLIHHTHSLCSPPFSLAHRATTRSGVKRWASRAPPAPPGPTPSPRWFMSYSSWPASSPTRWSTRSQVRTQRAVTGACGRADREHTVDTDHMLHRLLASASSRAPHTSANTFVLEIVPQCRSLPQYTPAYPHSSDHNFVITFITVVMIHAADFWTTKNVTGARPYCFV